MSEPISSALGVKFSTAIAGFFGGVVSLAFIQGLTRRQAIVAVTVGTLTAAYLTPAAMAHYQVGEEMQNGAAFVLGLCAMNIVPAIKRFVALRADKAVGKGDGGAA